jgi:type IV pilus assembly protein PilM
MTFFRKTDAENFFGLDVSDLSIKMVQLKKNKGKNKIQALGKYNLKEGFISNGEIINAEGLVQAIKQLISKPIYGSITTKNIVACLPENKTFIKTLLIEKSANQLIDMIISEIESTIPYGLDEIYYDWQIIDQDQTSYRILFAAAPKKIVDSYISVFNQAGLSIIALETESMGFCRCVLKESKGSEDDEKKTYAILDIGAKRTTIAICSEKSIAMTVGIDASGESATKIIAETLQINPTQAEKAKIICGLDKTKAEGIIGDILESITKETTNRIKQAMLYYEDNNPESGPIKELIISGGGSNIKDLDKIIAEKLAISVKPADVFINIDETINKFYENFTETHNINMDILHNKKSKKPSDSKNTITTKQNSSLAFATAIGLALRTNAK